MIFLRRRLLSSAALIIIFLPILASAATLPPDEVGALQQIGRTLEKRDWNFSVDPCSGLSNWVNPNPINGFENVVTCNCSFANNTVCHVVSIVLRGQNLSGTVPPELVRLPFLQQIDLTRNYLNGTIPKEWGSMQLMNISLLGNRLSGPIPKEIANISTLIALVLEINQLSGTIPPELGNLYRIERLLLTSNNLMGELPGELAKLANLQDFRIGDNQFTGSIPDFIQNWTHIEKLVIQGSGLSGPIPLGIASLTKLTDLRISDLVGSKLESTFPPLSNARNLRILILRSCNIVGKLPEFVGSFTRLEVLDLSFNQIAGRIPNSFFGLRTSPIEYIYLTGNILTGPVPDWMLRDEGIDLSLNRLPAFGSSGASSCQILNEGILSCLRSFSCSRSWSSLHINCGGRQVEVDNRTMYVTDTHSGGFFQSTTNWMMSSTGHFMDSDSDNDIYIWKSSSRITGDNSELMTDARLSPLSLFYYGLCMVNGNYTIKLHFAEIMFTDDRTYSSLGRRLFDIYIQGMLVRKDFNIEAVAGGVNRQMTMSFSAEVFDGTLVIRFNWAGKGTTGIPVRGVYGPLISAISVEPGFIPPSEPDSKLLSAGAIVGIVTAVVLSISLLLVVLWRGFLKRKYTMEQDLRELDLHTGSFTLRQIKAATNNFDAANKIGEGGFGSVYKGNMSDGTIIAVKQLSSKSNQGNREFVNEIGLISAQQHPNLVKLYGCCVEANQLLLVYEYMENNCLARALFGPEEYQLKLDWRTRHNICVGIARGLAYLHEESRLKIVHRDIKATNVLLDNNLNPKISDFGLAKLHEEDNSHISSRVAGTLGYMAPEYALMGQLTNKADVYSFGIVLLEIVSGKGNSSMVLDGYFGLLEWAHRLKKEGKLIEIIDSRLGSDFDLEEVRLTINVALLCANALPNVRPSMSKVVRMLEGQVDEKIIKDMTDILLITDLNESHTMSIATDVSVTTASDHYPANFDANLHEIDRNRDESRPFIQNNMYTW